MVKHLVLRLDGDFFPYFLYLRHHTIIISLQCVEGTIRAIVNGFSVPLIHWYQNIQAGLGVIVLMHRDCRGPAVSAVANGACSSSLCEDFGSGEYPTHPKTLMYVNPRDRFFVVGYVREGVWGSIRVHSFFPVPVFYLGLVLLNFLSHLARPFLPLGTSKRALLDLMLDKAGQWDCKSWCIDHPCRDCVNALGLKYIFFTASSTPNKRKYLEKA